MPKLAFISNFYNNPERVLAQVAYWESLPERFLSQIEFILVDDGSEKRPAFRPTHLNLRIFRVTSAIAWNQSGARNLGAFHAEAPWILYADIDQRFYLNPMERLLAGLDQLDPMVMYYPRTKNVVDLDGSSSPVHVNTILVNTKKFKEIGLYDEDFAGCYGFEDLYLPRVWEQNGGRRAALTDVDYFEDMRFGTQNLSREFARNQVLTDQKIEAGCKNAPGILRFGWKAVPLAPSMSASPTGAKDLAMQSLLIEGWRGVNQSYALVNQHQILNLLPMAQLQLFHRDLPFAFDWDATRHDPGFSPEDRQRIMAVPDPGEAKIDAVYRIASPFRASDSLDRRKTATFMVTELGLTETCFCEDSLYSDSFTRDANVIVTPSSWARERIVEFGFHPEKVHVVPHGVDPLVFYPTPPDERRACRANLALRDDDVVFLNVGACLWNKGIDLLLRAFAVVRTHRRNVKLILKDQRDVYGISVETVLREVTQTCPELAAPDTLAAITVIPGNLDQTQLRLLFGVADCYVSPYRAEGFNLPVLEAIACGLPIIVTQGGATDDYCSDDVALRVSGRPGSRIAPGSEKLYRFVEPDFDDLVSAMTTLARRLSPQSARYAPARARVLQDFSWQRAAADVARLTVGH
jgi:glycosyltransferase involved in cell wall biosynthesis